MTSGHQKAHGPRTDRLHPFVYRAILGLALWMVLMAWGFLGPHSYAAVALAVVTGFAVMAMVIPIELWRLWRRARDAAEGNQASPKGASASSFRDWVTGELEIRRGRLPGVDAAVAILLPAAAAAIGMTALVVVWHLTPH